MSGQIFISYRRDDSAGFAGRLYDRLHDRLPQNKIFIDVDSINPGIDFVEAIEKSVGACDVLIAVIGKHWLISADEEGRRRLDNPKDFVRTEIATALKRGIRVIPVLVEGASIPRDNDLPDDLKALARRQALGVSHDRFRADADRLVGAVEQALESARLEQQRKREEEQRLGAERLEREEAERRRAEQEREQKERLEVERRQRDALDRLEAEKESERLQTKQREAQRHQEEEQQRPSAEERLDERERLGAERHETELKDRVAPLRQQKPRHERQAHEPQSPLAGPVTPSTLLDKRWKLPAPKDERLRWLAWSAIALILVLAMTLIGSTILGGKRSSPNSPVSPPSPSIVSNPASQGKQPVEQPGFSRRESPRDRVFWQETAVAGVRAELTRFVRSGNLTTAEVTFRNTGSIPAKLSCDDWQLIDEQTGNKSSPTAQGGRISSSYPESLTPGAAHVAWAKFKTEPGDLSSNKYSVNVESILDRPFEGLTPDPAAPQQPSQQETRVAGVRAELTRFVRSGNLTTAEVTFRNTGSIPAKFSCDDWQLIDEQTADTSHPVAEGGHISSSYPESLTPGATHVAWAKFKTEPGDLSTNKYSVNIESIFNRPFEGVTPDRAAPQQPSQQETKVAGVRAELTRFVRSVNLITAEVTLRNTGSEPVKVSCDDWQLINEQTGDKSSPAATGGRVSSSYPESLTPGAAHVAWAKFKTEPGDLSDSKYSVNIESILNRPFEGLAVKSQ
jgi:hypothetical protein